MTWLCGQWVGGGLRPRELQGEPTSGAVPTLPPHALFPRAFRHLQLYLWPRCSASSSAVGRGPGASGCWISGATSTWGYCWLGPADPQAEPRPLPSGGLLSPWPLPGPGSLPRDLWLTDGGSSDLWPLRVQPAAALGCLPQGPTLSLSRAPAGGSTGRRVRWHSGVQVRGLLASPGPGPGAHTWVGPPAHAESPHSDKPPVPSSRTWPHPREPPMPVFPRSLPTAGSCCHPNRALRGLAPSPTLAGKAGSTPACSPSALRSRARGPGTDGLLLGPVHSVVQRPWHDCLLWAGSGRPLAEAVACPHGARGQVHSRAQALCCARRSLPDTEGVAEPLLSRCEGRGLLGGCVACSAAGPSAGLMLSPSQGACAGGLCLEMPTGLGRDQWGSHRGPWTEAWGPTWSLCHAPHPVWEPEGRAGLRPQSPDGRAGPGESGRRGWEGSWLSGPKSPPVRLVPTAPEAAWSQRPPCQPTPGTGDCLGQGQEPTGMRLLPGGWATSMGLVLGTAGAGSPPFVTPCSPGSWTVGKDCSSHFPGR